MPRVVKGREQSSLPPLSRLRPCWPLDLLEPLFLTFLTREMRAKNLLWEPVLGLLKRCLHFSDEWRIAEQDLNVQNRGQRGCGAVRNQGYRGRRGERTRRLP